jgi:hypothetical protein
MEKRMENVEKETEETTIHNLLMESTLGEPKATRKRIRNNVRDTIDRAKQNKTKQNKTKQNKTKQNKTKQKTKNKTKQNKTKQNKTKNKKQKTKNKKQNKTKQKIKQQTNIQTNNNPPFYSLISESSPYSRLCFQWAYSWVPKILLLKLI